MKMAKSSPMLGTYSSYVTSILRVPSYLYIVCTRIFFTFVTLEFQDRPVFVHHLLHSPRNNKGVCFTCLFFVNLPDPRGLGCARTLRYAWLYPRQSQASLRGYNGDNPRTSPKNRQCFFRKISVSKFLVYLGKTDARHKKLRYEAGRVVGPPTPPGYGTPLTTSRLSRL